MAKKVSLKDIANKVGVSTALVSYVLNGLEKEKRVGPEVVKKIRAAAKELNYKPNQIARSLRKGSTNTIGLIVADIANPFFGQLARIIEDESIRNGYTVIFGSSDENCKKSQSLVDTFLNRQVDGFIIVPTEGSQEQIASLIEKEVPLVLIDRYLPEVKSNFVVLDNFSAVYNSVEHLLENGYKRVGMVAYQNSLVHMEERTKGYMQAMKDAERENEICITELPYHFDRKEMDRVIDDIYKNKKCDAVVFATNALALAGLYAIRNLQIQVPDELALVGFDGNEAFDFFNPPLTFIQQPMVKLGHESVRILIEQMKGKKELQNLKLDSQLVVRGSC
ncbi:LacI family DNA-binding transcriptional regulator [Sunxiuqinia sp. A32]|uniref:LacI family DNA-binding transcriptional regulator n=1 Tax=Sunxiuqinia sp. A32 TaxID=3461496 RepID=UPI00404644E7